MRILVCAALALVLTGCTYTKYDIDWDGVWLPCPEGQVASHTRYDKATGKVTRPSKCVKLNITYSKP